LPRNDTLALEEMVMPEPARVSRVDDYTNTKLVLTRTDDGDVGVMVGFGTAVTFCNPRNGGYSPNTVRALEQLFEAMLQDNAMKPDKRNAEP
jgi:gentisate 1,2-dioxygenase